MPVRKIPMNYRGLTGRHAVEPGGRSIGFESSLERDFVALMLFDSEVTGIEEQPVRIYYLDPVTSRRRFYTPDFLVHRKNSPSLLVEVKPDDVLKRLRAELEPRFNAARDYANAEGWVFEIRTERDIRTPRLQNVRFLLPYRNRRMDPGLSTRILSHLRECGVSTVGGTVNACWNDDMEAARGLSALWFLLSTGRINTDLDRALTQDTQIKSSEGDEYVR